MKLVLIQACAPAGNAIFAQADGSSGPESLRTISSITVTGWLFVRRVRISLLSWGFPRTLTWVATHTAGPATSGTVFSSAPLFLATAFCPDFFFDFFLALFVAGALVMAGADSAVGAAMAGSAGAAFVGGATFVIAGAGGGVSTGAAGGGFVTVCASKLVVSRVPTKIQQFFFITQLSRDFISASVNVRHL